MAAVGVTGNRGVVSSVNGDPGPAVVLTAASVGADTAGAATAAVNAHVAATDPHGDRAYAVQRANHTGTQSADTLTDGTTNKAFLATERTKLTGIASGATANSSDATLLARANHTGTQAVGTITGLGGAATLNVGTTAGTVAAGDVAAGAAQKANNLSDLANAGTARTNLGLGNAATKNVGTTSADVAAGDVAAGALQKSVATAKGDVFVATASGVVVRQAVGSDGQVLAADSTQTNGVAWVTRSPDVQTFTTSGTWTMPTGAKTVLVQGIAPGGGGGSGRRGAAGTVRCGGGGGAGGAYAEFLFRASELTSPVTVTVGAGGTGAAAQTVDDTNGNPGINSGTHTFGSYLRAMGGANGSGGTAANGLAGSARTGTINGTQGGAASTTGGVGAGPTSAVIPTGAGVGGNSGGGITSANVASNGGAASGNFSIYPHATVPAGGVVDGALPVAGASVPAGIPMSGTAAGGGAASITTAAQAGGVAGNYGVGGSGGGASLNGNNSGAGSDGTGGMWRVTTYF